MLEKLESKKKSVYVVEQLLDAIDKGVYSLGDKLPSEQVIVEQTGVSRPSVREALGALRLVGVLETRMGDGTYVKSTKCRYDPSLHVIHEVSASCVRSIYSLDTNLFRGSLTGILI